MSASFEALSASTGIALPATLRQLIDSGAASYDDPARTALAALDDAEWLSAQARGPGLVAVALDGPGRRHERAFAAGMGARSARPRRGARSRCARLSRTVSVTVYKPAAS